jgi:hypothetical protein
MDKITKYRQIIVDVLTEYASIPVNTIGGAEIENQLMIDPVNDHYQILSIGWEGSKRAYYPIFHVDIKDGKIWIQEDASDADLTSTLEERGIASSDIVLAFHAPYKRPYTGYAVA